MGRDMSWQYIRDNWPKIKERFAGILMLQRLVSSVCSQFASEERAKEIEVCEEWLVFVANISSC